jgi:hypothetical protein
MQDRVLSRKLSQNLSEYYFDYWANYIYHNRDTPCEQILSDFADEPVLCKMNLGDIDETILWLKWVFNN